MQLEKAVPRSGSPASQLVPDAARPDRSRLRGAWARGAALVERLVATIFGGPETEDTLQMSLPLDGRGPRAARIVLEDLRGRITPSVLGDAQLVVSELVTNAVRHSGVCAGGAVVLRVELAGTMVRVEVTDPGGGDVIAPRAPDLEHGGGFGLHVVRALSERWGLEQVAAGGTRVWAQLPRVSPSADDSAREQGHG
jgi:serine/threonine-protein kinase RsbW